MKPPSERAKAIMANGGMLPGASRSPARRPRSWRRQLNGTAATAAGTATPARRARRPTARDAATAATTADPDARRSTDARDGTA